jgi:hypothetical protein
MTENQIVEAQMQQLGLTNSYGNQNTVNPNLQKGVTRNTQGSNKNNLTSNKNTLNSANSYSNQNPVIPNQIPNQIPFIPLSEQGKQAKGDLEVLIATGKSKKQDFIKKLSFNDLDNLPEKDIIKYHRIYQSNMAIKMNDSFGKVAVRSYCHLAGLSCPLMIKKNCMKI